MKVTPASSLLQPRTQQAMREALAAGTTVTVPIATAPDIAAIRAYFASPEGAALLARYTTAGKVEAPVATLDETGRRLVAQAIGGVVPKPGSDHAAFAASRTVALGMGTGAMIGGGLAAIVELTRAAEPTGAAALLVSLAGALVGAGAGGAMAGGILGEVEVGLDGSLALKAAAQET